jgi:hypothetical protein
MLGAGWTEIVALAAGFAIAVVAAPAGISGAVLLLPFQVSVLGTPSPAVTPTNLLYNVIATPGALYRYRRQQQAGGRLALVLIAGTLPGVTQGYLRYEAASAALVGSGRRACARCASATFPYQARVLRLLPSQRWSGRSTCQATTHRRSCWPIVRPTRLCRGRRTGGSGRLPRLWQRIRVVRLLGRLASPTPGERWRSRR